MTPGESKTPATLAERFWSLARGMEGTSDSTEPEAVVEHVLSVLDGLEAGRVGRDLTASTVNFLTLLRQYEVRGDLLYASPEQARGEQMDERSLVFSVGVLLFEKMTGRHPFGAEGNPDRLARIRRGEMASGVNYFPRVPAELRTVLVKAMGPFPEERWDSLAELRAELELFVVRARDPGSRGKAAGPTTRPLPALPEPGSEATRRTAPRITPSTPSIELSRMASMSGRNSALRAEVLEPQPDPDEAGRWKQLWRWAGSWKPRSRRLPRGAWGFGGVLLGVLVTSLVFIAAWPADRGMTAPPASRPSAALPHREPAARPVAAPGPTPAAGATPRANPDPSPRPSPAAPAPAPVFDIEAGGQAALAAVRTCVAAHRAVQFGASLVYDPRSGLSRRIYFGAAQHLLPPERACLEKGLLQLPAGAPPEGSATVTYGFNLAPGEDKVRARLVPAP